MDDGTMLKGRAATVPVVIGVLGLAPQSAGNSNSGMLVRRVPLPRILYGHGLTRQTGVLTLERDSSIRTVHLVSGAVVWCESSDPDFRFSEWLTRDGAVTAEKASAASALVRTGACRYGEALLRLDAAGPHELARLAERFILDVILSAFEWRRGTYDFQRAAGSEHSFEPPVHLTSPIPMERLIFEGFARMSDTGLAAAWLGDLSAPRSFVADPFQFVDLGHVTEQHILLLQRLSTGCFSIAEVMHLGILTPEETLRFLGALDATGDLVTV